MSVYKFDVIGGPTGPTGADSRFTGPTGSQGVSYTGPTGAASTVTGPTGATGSVRTTDNLLVNSVQCTNVQVDQLTVSDSVTVASALLGPTTLPTFTSQMIGYTTFKTGTSTTVSSGNINYTLNDDPLILPAGVWYLTATCFTAATSSNYTLTGFYIGIAETLNANVYNNNANGLRYTKHTGSWSIVYNDTRFRPIFTYNQMYHVLSGTKSLYGFFQLSGGSGGTLSISGTLHATRIA